MKKPVRKIYDNCLKDDGTVDFRKAAIIKSAIKLNKGKDFIITQSGKRLLLKDFNFITDSSFDNNEE